MSPNSVAEVRCQARLSLGPHDGRGLDERRADRVGGAGRRRVAPGGGRARARRRRSLLHRRVQLHPRGGQGFIILFPES